MTRILDRYVIRDLSVPFLLSTALLTFFLIIDRIYHLTDLVVTKGIPFPLVLGLLVFMLPSFLVHTLPMALLVAVLLLAGRMAGGDRRARRLVPGEAHGSARLGR